MEVSNLEAQTMSIDYTVAGFVDDITRFDGTVIDVGYNARGQVNSIDYDNNTQDDAFTYRDNGQLLTAVNESGTISLDYDDAGRTAHRPLRQRGHKPA